MIKDPLYDLFIIGGGIHGAGIAADATLRGLSVILCEQGDLASGTSSHSSKLIHGGLRYLEQKEFSLVRKSLKERDVLHQKASYLVRPLRFVIPQQPQMGRPSWLIWLGLKLYDHLYHSKFFLSSQTMRDKIFSVPLKAAFQKGFIYSDAQTSDARLVITNAIAAHQKGADIYTRTRFETAQPMGNYWLVTVRDLLTEQTRTIRAKCLVNAAGPWLDDVLMNRLHLTHEKKLQLVKGSHLILKRFYQGEHGYLFQHTDGRIVFVVPYQHDFVLIGTTDVLFEESMGNPKTVITASVEEEQYLLRLVNEYFQQTLCHEDILYRYAGVRPLVAGDKDNISKQSRDYRCVVQEEQGLPLLSIVGGKLTTYRQVAEDALNLLQPYFPKMKPCTTQHALLPGAVIAIDEVSYEQSFLRRYSWLPPELAQRYLRSYGMRAELFLGETHSLPELGIHFGCGLYQAEVDYLIREEWAQTSDDILWRRTVLGLRMTLPQAVELENYVLEKKWTYSS
jgi:glycerol-3-phosphate dehydrogenase